MLGPHQRLVPLLVCCAVLVVATEGIGFGSVLLLLAVDSLDFSPAPSNLLAPVVEAVQALTLPQRVQFAALALVGLTLLRGTLHYLQELIGIRIRTGTEQEIQIQLFRRFHEISLDFLQKEGEGALTAGLTQYTSRLGHLVLSTTRAIANMIVLIFYVIVAFVVSWSMALVAVALLTPVTFLFRPALTVRLRKAGLRVRETIKKMQDTVHEHLSAMRVIRIFGRTSWSLERFESSVADVHDQEFRSQALASLNVPLFNLFNALVFAALMVAAALFYTDPEQGVLTRLALFLGIAFRLMGPLSQLTQHRAQVSQAGPLLEALSRYSDAEVPVGPVSGSARLQESVREVSFDQVAYTYPTGELPALHDVDLIVRRGKLTALVGPSGAGKSTIVGLLARLFDPVKGTIRVNGIDLRTLDLDHWRDRVAIVSQDVFLFRTSVLENLRFARPHATDSEIEKACRMAQAHDFISELPEGYLTLVDERGMRLSGGQRQRIALARALLKQADLLILDEATSEIDSTTEKTIQNALEVYRRGRAVLVIAHRLSTVAHADCIYLLDRGQVVEWGRHDELMARRGLYARMIQSQQLGAEPLSN